MREGIGFLKADGGIRCSSSMAAYSITLSAKMGDLKRHGGRVLCFRSKGFCYEGFKARAIRAVLCVSTPNFFRRVKIS